MSKVRVAGLVFLGTSKDRHELYIRPVNHVPPVLFTTGTPHPELTEAEWCICGP